MAAEASEETAGKNRWLLVGGIFGWVITLAAFADAATQVAGITPLNAFFVLQALTPYFIAPVVLIALVSLVRRRWRMLIPNLLTLGVLGWLCAPVVVPAGRGTAPTNPARITIAEANAYFENTDADRAAAALLASGADALAIVEYSPQLASALVLQGIDTKYPYHVSQSASARSGIALFSRFPLGHASIEPIGTQDGIVATIDINGTPLRILVVHPLPGEKQHDLASWRHDLGAIGAAAAAPGPPIAIIGDFNATRWHPAFRELLDRGFADVHTVLNHGWSRSWPVGYPLIPPFVRIDHALVGAGVYPEAIRDLAVPGSDHRGFVVTLAEGTSGNSAG